MLSRRRALARACAFGAIFAYAPAVRVALAQPALDAAASVIAEGAGAGAGEAGAPAAASIAHRASELLFRAMSLVGIRYRRGGNSPDTGFDCSGFVGYLFREVLNVRLPRSADEIWRHGAEVVRDALEPGDLVFFNTLRRPFSHVGVYVGEDRFIHAPASGGAVRTESMNERYWTSRWNGARRIAA